MVPNAAYPSEEYQPLSGELASAVNLMMERLSYQYLEHAIFPVSYHITMSTAMKADEFDPLQVMVFSFSGDKARVVQVHFDEASGDLIVRPSKYLHFPTDDEALPRFIGWMMSSACGNTRFTDTKPMELRFAAEGGPGRQSMIGNDRDLLSTNPGEGCGS